MDTLEKAACVKFRPATVVDKDWIHIDFKEPGCFARIGFYGPDWGLHEVNLEEGPVPLTATCLIKGVVVHELLHVLGFVHEQTRPDRDEYMTIRWEKMMVNSFKLILALQYNTYIFIWCGNSCLGMNSF